MRILPRRVAALVSRAVDHDLRAELQFHIDMRIERYVAEGMTPREAETLAHKQFGDMEVAMNGMRRARLASTRAALISVTTAAVVVAGFWAYTVSSLGAPVLFPSLPGMPPPARTDKRLPPPPPPPPTWDEFVAKVNRFGESGK